MFTYNIKCTSFFVLALLNIIFCSLFNKKLHYLMTNDLKWDTITQGYLFPFIYLSKLNGIKNSLNWNHLVPQCLCRALLFAYVCEGAVNLHCFAFFTTLQLMFFFSKTIFDTDFTYMLKCNHEDLTTTLGRPKTCLCC